VRDVVAPGPKLQLSTYSSAEKSPRRFAICPLAINMMDWVSAEIAEANNLWLVFRQFSSAAKKPSRATALRSLSSSKKVALLRNLVAAKESRPE
jgi:hypothetical protein